MAKISIKSPQEDSLHKESSKSSGTYNGVPGYQKRTSSPNAKDEKTFDGTPPKNNLDIKTPAAGKASVTKDSGNNGNY